MRNQSLAPKILVLGGVERVPYAQLGREVEVSYVPHIRRMRNAHIAAFDAVVCLTSESSHAMVNKVKKVACRYGVPLYFLRTSGGTRFQCLLGHICDSGCPGLAGSQDAVTDHTVPAPVNPD